MPEHAPKRFALYEQTSNAVTEPFRTILVTEIGDCTSVEVRPLHGKPVSLIVTKATTAVTLLGFLLQGTGVAA
jgi:hypothetical protein